VNNQILIAVAIEAYVEDANESETEQMSGDSQLSANLNVWLPAERSDDLCD